MTIQSELKRVGLAKHNRNNRKGKRSYKGTYSVPNYTKKKLTKRDHIHVAHFVHRWPKADGWKRKFHLSSAYISEVKEMKRFGLLGAIAAAGGYVNTNNLEDR